MSETEPTRSDDVADDAVPEVVADPAPAADAVPEPIEATDATETAAPEADTAAENAPEVADEVAPEVADRLAVEVAEEPAAAADVAPEASSIEAVEPAEAAQTTSEPSEPSEATEAPEPADPVEPAEITETPEAADSPSEAAATSSPAPRPGARPVPRPPARRGRPTPAVVAPHAPAVVPPSLSEEEVLAAASFGRVTEDGTVLVREATGEREVGQFPGANVADALALYVRRYADLHAKVVLAEARITAADLSPKEMDSTLEHLAEELAAPAAVGDLDALRARLQSLQDVASGRRAVAEAERAAAKQAALEARTAMVEAAEKIAATDPERMQWRPAGEQLRVLLDQWKEAQRRGPRLDRHTEDSLWKRFSHARSTFDRERRRWFAELEKSNSAAKAAKEQIVAKAQSLAASTDWAGTSAAFRDLMSDWKSAGRASKKDDDALWAQFRAAQDTFFAARDAFHKQTDAEFAANLAVKLELLEQAERLVPVKDIGAAKAALRGIQDRWEKAGKVPRADIQRVEARLRAVEQAVRDAEQAKWQRSNPETRARAEGAAAQLRAAIASLEADLAKAEAAGNTRKATELRESLQARRAWLEQVERAAAESRG